MPKLNEQQHRLLFFIAILGIVFYAVSPVLFPDAEGLRQPELLPVYSAMIGLGYILKGDAKNGSE
jgi:hypothetical protein